MQRRRCYTVQNGIASDLDTVKSGIPQGSVLGPTLFSVYTSDLPEAITTATTYMYADDTTLYCIGNSIDVVISELNQALEELFILVQNKLPCASSKEMRSNDPPSWKIHWPIERVNVGPAHHQMGYTLSSIRRIDR